MTRAVLDPNVLVSAFVTQRGGSPDLIVRAWRKGAFELVVSPQLIAELADVLGRPKFALQAGDGRAEAYIVALAGDALQIGDPPNPPAVLSEVTGQRRSRMFRYEPYLRLFDEPTETEPNHGIT